MKLLFKAFMAAIVVTGLVGGALWWRRPGSEAQAVAYRTAQVQRADLVVAISATGTVEPEEVIDVGAQVAGQILTFGKDTEGKTVDYGSVVEAGAERAGIDDAVYRAEAASAAAQVRSAKAGVQRAEADLGQLQAKLHQAERDWQRAQKLQSSQSLAQSSFDGYQAAYETARANVAVGQAAISQARASLGQAEASLQRADRNLTYCTIRSPVKGVIIDRRVNIGQTVVASLNAPSLFLIAKDLTRMQVWVAVNEADVGKITPGQPVHFTVDAFPEQTFTGQVRKLRLNAAMTQNVVTYTVEIATDNASGQLLPYLTANVRFEVSRADNVLAVPAAALRWRPTSETGDRQPAGPAVSGDQNLGQPAGGADAKSNGVIWVLEGRQVKPLPVRAGLSDGTLTAVNGRGLAEGLAVVVGAKTADNGKAASTNPFTPKLPRPPGAGAGPRP